MNYEKIITEIKTIREFKQNQPVDSNLLSLILSETKEQETLFKSNLEYKIIEDGKDFFNLFNGKIGYFGKLIEAPNYILVFGKNNSDSRIDAGYSTEWIRFRLEEEKLSSCWLSPTKGIDYSETFGLDKEDTLLAAIAIGTKYSGVFMKNTEKQAERKGIVDFVYNESWGNEITWDKLEQMGISEAMYMTKFAPSWGNIQPWNFVITTKEVFLTMEKSDEHDYDLETGIIALYFMKSCESKGIKINVQKCENPQIPNLIDEQDIKLKFFF